MMGMSASTHRAREIEKAACLAFEQYRARRAGIEAVESKANVWFQDEDEQVADEALSPHWRMRRHESYWWKL